MGVFRDAHAALQGSKNEKGGVGRVDVASDRARRLAFRQGIPDARQPGLVELVRALPETLVDGRHLLGQIVQGAAETYLGLVEMVRCPTDGLLQTAQGWYCVVAQGLDPGGIEVGPNPLVEDRVAQLSLASEIVIECALGHTRLVQDGVQAGGLKALVVYLSEGRFQ